jgi:hypothetical protein
MTATNDPLDAAVRSLGRTLAVSQVAQAMGVAADEEYQAAIDRGWISLLSWSGRWSVIWVWAWRGGR